MTGFNGLLLRGIAQHLHDAGVGNYTPGSVAAELNGLPAITLVNLPNDPDRVICLTDYPIQADPLLTEVVIGVQLRIRGTSSPMVASDIRDAAYDALQGVNGLILSTGVPLVHMYWQSEAPIGPDNQDRYERTVNYYVHTNRTAGDQE